MPSDPEHAAMSEHAWVRWMIGVTAAMCAGVAAFNAVVDPTAQLGSGVLEPIAAGPRDRTAKVELLERGGVPPLVVLGSSRTKKLDPAWLGPLGTDGVNAAVVGGDLFEARVLTAWLARRAERLRQPMPQLVVGIDVEQFRDSSLHGSGFLDLPQVAAVARREASGSDGSVAAEATRLNQLLLTLQSTKASLASLRARVTEPAAEDEVGGEEQATSDFTDRGVPLADRRWRDAERAVAATRARDLVRGSILEYRDTYRFISTQLDEDAVADLRALVRIARDADGPAPLLYVTPAHPRFDAALEDVGRHERLANVMTLLVELGADGDARALDCSRCVDGAASSWIDGTHPSPLGTAQLAARLEPALDGAAHAPSVTRPGRPPRS